MPCHLGRHSCACCSCLCVCVSSAVRQMADAAGVDVGPVEVAPGLLVVPLLSWYNSAFDVADPRCAVLLASYLWLLALALPLPWQWLTVRPAWSVCRLLGD
jgi:hypothetical protein